MILSCLTAAKLHDVLVSTAERVCGLASALRPTAIVDFKATTTATPDLIRLANSIVTSADLTVQEAVLESLLRMGLRECSVVAEENTASLCYFRGTTNWPAIYVDPIDGTLAYSLGSSEWESKARAAGFSSELLEYTRRMIAGRHYGLVLGAEIAGENIVSVCSLPELGILYHTFSGNTYRNRQVVRLSRSHLKSKIALGRRLLDPSGKDASVFTSRGYEVRWFNGSNPGLLWHLLEGDCCAYAGTQCAFDTQLAAVCALGAGYHVADALGNPFEPNLSGIVPCIVIASTPEEGKLIGELVLERIRMDETPGPLSSP